MFNIVCKRNAVPIIKIRKNASTRSLGSTLRAKSVREVKKIRHIAKGSDDAVSAVWPTAKDSVKPKRKMDKLEISVVLIRIMQQIK